MTARTPNLGLAKPDFDRRQWQDLINDNFTVLDALWAKFFATTGLAGVWQNATMYPVGTLVVDEVLGSIWRSEVSHTSPSSGTFLEARTAFPTYWSNYTIGVRYRGPWASTAAYAIGDFVATDFQFAVANAAHSSGGVFSSTDGSWEILIDGGPMISTAAAYASTAASYASIAQAAATTAAAAAGSAWCGLATGTANAIILAAAPTVADGSEIRFEAASANTSAVTINGVAVLDAYGNALVGGEFQAGRQYSVVYNSSNTSYEFYGPQAIIVGIHSFPVSADAMTIRSASGASAFSSAAVTSLMMINGLLFGSTSAQYAEFGIPAPKSIASGGTVTYKAIWTATQGTAAATCIWQLQAVGAGDGDALDAAYGTAVDTTDLYQGVLKQHIGPVSAAVTISSFAREDEIRFRVSRKISGNTLVADAILRWIVINFTLDKSSDG